MMSNKVKPYLCYGLLLLSMQVQAMPFWLQAPIVEQAKVSQLVQVDLRRYVYDPKYSGKDLSFNALPQTSREFTINSFGLAEAEFNKTGSFLASITVCNANKECAANNLIVVVR